MDEAEAAKETEKPWLEREMENQENVVSWKPIKEKILSWKKGAIV